MEKWKEDCIQSTITSETEQDLFSVFMRVAQYLDLEYCSFGIRLPLPVADPKIIMHSNYSQAWHDRYVQNNYASIDPTVEHGFNSSRMFTWDKNLCAVSPEFWEEARSFGINHGLTQACHSPDGIVSMLSYSRSQHELTHQEVFGAGMNILWLSQLAHESFSNLIVPVHLPDVFIDLTEREIEVLRWTADGKTTAEIGLLLSINDGTVNYHLNNAISKLGAPNRTAAVIKALALGML